MEDAGHILTGATFRNEHGIFAFSTIIADFEGNCKTFSFASIERTTDSLAEIAQRIKERSTIIINWTMEKRFETLECELA